MPYKYKHNNIDKYLLSARVANNIHTSVANCINVTKKKLYFLNKNERMVKYFEVVSANKTFNCNNPILL